MARKKSVKRQAPRPLSERPRHRTASDVPPVPSVKSTTHNGKFTMRDEARNTAFQQTSRDRDAKLREKPVEFISAGPIKPLDDPLVAQPENSPLQSPATQNKPLQSSHLGQSAQPLRQNDSLNRTREAAMTGKAVNTDPFQHAPAIAQEDGDRGGDESSDSDGDVVLFKRHPKHRKMQSSMSHSGKPAQSVGEQMHEGRKIAQSPSPEPQQAMEEELNHVGSTKDAEEELNLRASGEVALVTLVDTSSHDAASDIVTSSSDGNGSNVRDVRESPEADIDDETLARLLSKQEELGLGSDELIGSSSMYKFMDDFAVDDNLVDVTYEEMRRRHRRLAVDATDGLSAADVAAAFDDLDLMDWSSPRQRPNRKVRRAVPDFDVSDSELEAVLAGAWKKDREKKKNRKLQREEARAQGLLGKGNSPGDLRVKYPAAMTFDDIQIEIRAFLMSSQEQLVFPPLDAAARKTVHELASRFKIKSKSSGSGNQRAPVLYRTKATHRYAEESFELTTTRFRRRYFPRLDVRGKPVMRNGRGGGGSNGLALRDGDIVGAAAPELAESNKGRTMLQKMGWSTGMALGALDNKGLLQPVAQIVKRSKAGLG
jgi:hypothetical protein